MFELLKDNQVIADLGSGLQGGFWWSSVKQGSTIDAFDLYNDTTESKDHITFHKLDVTKIFERREFHEKFDLIVADHIFEHVHSVEDLARSMNWIAKPGALAHVGLPMADNFPDIFYRLIHRFDSGGYVQKLKYDDVIDVMTNAGFSLVKAEPWEEDWLWFEKLFDLDYNKVERVSKEEIKFMADVFRKELTSDKGYLYGYEFVFKKGG